MKPINTQTLMDWANRTLGASKCKRIKYVNNGSGELGNWDWQGTIRLNLREIKSYPTLYRTLAHEWTHAQQTWRDYKKGLKFGYRANPMEVAARRAELQLWK